MDIDNAMMSQFKEKAITRISSASKKLTPDLPKLSPEELVARVQSGIDAFKQISPLTSLQEIMFWHVSSYVSLHFPKVMPLSKELESELRLLVRKGLIANLKRNGFWDDTVDVEGLD